MATKRHNRVDFLQPYLKIDLLTLRLTSNNQVDQNNTRNGFCSQNHTENRYYICI